MNIGSANETTQIAAGKDRAKPPSVTARETLRKWLVILGRLKDLERREAAARAELDDCALKRAQLLSQTESIFHNILSDSHIAAGNTRVRIGIRRRCVLESIYKAGSCSVSDIAEASGLKIRDVMRDLIDDINRGVISKRGEVYSLTEKGSVILRRVNNTSPNASVGAVAYRDKIIRT